MPNLASKAVIQRSAQDFIKSALRIVGALRSGQNLTADELSDCLQVANDLLDAWSAKRTRLVTVSRVTTDQNNVALSLLANKAVYMLGNLNNNEDLLLARPPRLERVSIMYSVSQQTPVELPMEMYDDVQWQGVSNKSTPSLLPQVCYIESGYPDLALNFWPVPTQANPIVLYMWIALTQFTDLKTKFSFPPGYARALRFNLAVELAAEFPCDLQKFQIAQKIAAQSLMDIESLNSVIKEATCDPALLGSGYPRGNIFTSTASRTHP